MSSLKYIAAKFSKLENSTSLFFISVSIFLYTPLFILYSDNKQVSGFTMVSFLPALGLCLNVALLSIFIRIFKPKVNSIVNYLFSGLALYILTTVIFYPVQSGVLDGVNETIHKGDRLFHLAWLCICLSMSILSLYKEKIGSLLRRVVFVLGVFVLITSIYMGIAILPLGNDPEQDFQWQKSSALSAKDNIIVIALDALQGDLVNEVLANNTELAAHFDGFTSFTNVSSIFPGTGFSYRGILEGKLPNGDVKAIDRRSNLFREMHENGYRVSVSSYLNSMFKIFKTDGDTVDIIPATVGSNNIFEDFISLSILGSRRYLPFIIDHKLQQKEFGAISKVGEKRVLESLITHFNIDDNLSKRFLWLHSLMTHYPVRFTKEGNFSFELKEDDVRGEIEDALTLMAQMLQKLKEIGVYDNSLIIILSDHGFPKISVLKSLSANQLYLATSLGPFGPAAGQYAPTLMVKPPNAHNLLRYSETAVTLMDFRKTLNEFAKPGSGADFAGIDFLDFKNDAVSRLAPVLILKSKFNAAVDYNSTENWDTVELRMPFAEHYMPKVKQTLDSLQELRDALERYHADHGTYPVSENFDGLHTSWGRSGEDWIEGLVPLYLAKLPRDPRKTEDPSIQFLYRSNGVDYKLIAHNGVSIDFISRAKPEMIDPQRSYAYGYWTQGAQAW